ncbi:DNA recombination protein RmuC [Candidatus Parcubacteria bacterium]|nr:DNA recombination protein RmuC [Candidatus Parcubacteria bacterium]
MSVAILLVGVVVAILLALQLMRSGRVATDDGSAKLLLQQLNELSRTVDAKMSETNKMMHDSVRTQFGESAKLIREVTEGLTKLDETNRQVVSFADQLQSLENILKNPKQRGILGEYYLETLLKNCMPPGSFQMQYPFADGTIVDAAVFVKDKVIPVDSKFSLENYNRLAECKEEVERERLEKVFVGDLKLRIQETSKYIQPEQGTMDFAFMFIPHEAIYYDLIVNKIGAEDAESLIQRAASKYKVIIVSPTSFLAYLQTVLQGLKALQIEETAQVIVKRVEDLGKHLKSYEDYYQKLGNALGTAVNQYNFAGKELGKVDKDILRITGTQAGLETLTLERPALE